MGETVRVIGSLSEYNFAQNGQFDFFQRRGSPSWTNEGNLYTADRWFRFKQTGGGTGVFTQIQDAGLGNGSRSLRIGRTAGSNDTNQTEIIQALESKDCARMKGQKVTLSFKIRKGANFSGTAVNFYIGYGTGTDQGVVAAWTGAVTVSATPIPAASLSTTDYIVAKLTTTLPTSMNQVRYDVNYVPVGIAGANDYIEITEVMLNIGEYTPYVRHAETYEKEYLVMQRFYEKSYELLVTPGAVTSQGAWLWTGPVSVPRRISTPMKVRKRVPPTVVFYSPATGASGVTNRDSSGDTAINFNVSSETHIGFEVSSFPAGEVRSYNQWTADAEL